MSTEVSAVAVKALRDRTGLPMMECKKALQDAGGDAEAAIELLRKGGAKTMASRSGRETSCGRVAVFNEPGRPSAMVELQCESAPVANLEEFRQLADDLARQLATGPGAQTAEALLSQPSPSRTGMTLAEQKDELSNRIREVFNLARLVRVEGACAGYAHHTGTVGVLLELSGENREAARDICMHVAAMRPQVLNKEDLEPAIVAKEREILMEAARKEGKPENILAKMVEGRMRNFYAECVLREQPFVKDDKKSVGKFAQESGLELKRFVHWELGKGTA
jgi:elongation factor Ts